MLDTPIPGACLHPDLSERIVLIASSYRKLLGKQLAGLTEPSVATMWSAKDAILAHGMGPDPVFFFGNATALRLFECDWEAFTRMPSRLSAQPMDREERQRLLNRVTRDGYVDDYSGLRISAKGRRFFIPRATVWNLTDGQGLARGQAATFPALVHQVPHE